MHLTLIKLRISELPNDRVGRIKVIRIKDNLSKDLPNVKLVADLIVGQQDTGKFPNKFEVQRFDLENRIHNVKLISSVE